jgi:hypothetical protein
VSAQTDTLDAAPPAPSPSLGARLVAVRDTVAATAVRWFTTVTTRPIALYGTAALRIGCGLLFLAFLLREIPGRERLWGPNAAWSPALDQSYAQVNPWGGWLKSWYSLAATSSETWFEIWFFLLIVVSVVFTLGWRTRFTSLLFMMAVTTLHGRNVFASDPSDILLTIISVYLPFTACGRRWSLDAYLAARRPPRRRAWRERVAASPGLAELDEVRRRLVTLLHNCGLLLIGYQLCLIYESSSMWKIQGSTWQDGTALYYALHITGFEPWPALSNFMSSHSLMVAVVSYFTVFVQVGFVFALFNRRLKYVFLVGLIGMHLGIAVVLGLPWFSAMMLVGDAVFLPDRFWQAVGRGVGRATASVVRRSPADRRDAPVPVLARVTDPAS